MEGPIPVFLTNLHLPNGLEGGSTANYFFWIFMLNMVCTVQREAILNAWGNLWRCNTNMAWLADVNETPSGTVTNPIYFRFVTFDSVVLEPQEKSNLDGSDKFWLGSKLQYYDAWQGKEQGKKVCKATALHSCRCFPCTLLPGLNRAKRLIQKSYSLTLFDHFRPVKRPSEYFTKEWSE